MRVLKRMQAAALAGALALVIVPATADGQDFPSPPENWWTQLKVGDSATWNMNMGGFTGTIQITIIALDGSQITLRTENTMGGMVQPPQEQTVDAAVYDPEEALASMGSMGPPGAGSGAPAGAEAGTANLSQVGEETIEVSGRALNCIIYEIESGGQTVKSWYSPELPPVFMAGSVKVEMNMMGMGNGTVELVEFTGDPLN